MNGERYECERCGYVLGSWDKKPRFVDEFVKDSINDVLDKIRTEIETDLSHFCFDDWGNETTEWKEIIERYKGDCGRRIYADEFIHDIEVNVPTIIEADKAGKRG